MPCDIFLAVIFYFFFFFRSHLFEYNSSGLNERKYIASRGRGGNITPNFFSHFRGLGHFTTRGIAGRGSAATFQNFAPAATAHRAKQR